MKLIRHILALVLVAAFVNVYVSKTVHEVFEHEHTTHACENQDLDHLHELEIGHLDIICSFNLNSTEEAKANHSFETVLGVVKEKTAIEYLWLVKNLFYDLNLQRGPPTLV